MFGSLVTIIQRGEKNKRKLLWRKVYGKSYYNLQHTEKYIYNKNQVQQKAIDIKAKLHYTSYNTHE